MKTVSERIRHRMRKDRGRVTISLSMPDDVLEDLQEISPTLGFTNYQALMRAYIGDGLRKDLERLDQSPVQLLTEKLRNQGMPDEVIAEVLADSRLKRA